MHELLKKYKVQSERDWTLVPEYVFIPFFSLYNVL